MSGGLCAVLLAAGEGRRLRPLTEIMPKALCPVGNVALLDRALDAVAQVGLAGPEAVAVNAWHLADAIVTHVATHGRRAYVGVETGPVPLGSAGGLAVLRDWIDGRDVLVGNADAYLTGVDLAELLNVGAEDVSLLGVAASPPDAEFGALRFAGFSLLPWRVVERLPVEPADLVRAVWRPAEAAGVLRVVEHRGFYLDCGTPADYLAANLDAAARTGVDGSLIAPDATVTGRADRAVIGARAQVAGDVEQAVIWPGTVVTATEHLRRAIRYGDGATVRL